MSNKSFMNYHFVTPYVVRSLYRFPSIENIELTLKLEAMSFIGWSTVAMVDGMSVLLVMAVMLSKR